MRIPILMEVNALALWQLWFIGRRRHRCSYSRRRNRDKHFVVRHRKVVRRRESVLSSRRRWSRWQWQCCRWRPRSSSQCPRSVAVAVDQQQRRLSVAWFCFRIRARARALFRRGCRVRVRVRVPDIRVRVRCGRVTIRRDVQIRPGPENGATLFVVTDCKVLALNGEEIGRAHV